MIAAIARRPAPVGRLLMLATLSLVLSACGASDTENSVAAKDIAAAAPEPAALPAEGKIDRSHAGTEAPPIAFQRPDGAPTSLAAFRGRPVLVNLWATWCAPCKAEMPTLDALARSSAGRLQVLAISQDLQGEVVAPYFREAGLAALTPYRDTEVRFSTTFSATLPMTILYDSQGRELWRMTGGMDWSGPRAAQLIAEAR